MQAQIPPAQQLQYSSPQVQYAPDHGAVSDPTRAQHAEYTTGLPPDSNSTGLDMNPYPQQYVTGYGQPHAQQASQTHAQPSSRSSYLNQNNNQLPPLVPAMGPIVGGTNAPPVMMDDLSPQSSSPANHGYQTSQYMPAPPPPPQSMSQPHSSLPPPARAAASQPPQEKKMFNSLTRDGLKYSLEVVQQPQRARMCGFGDKDRRPITPPPCVRLVIIDVETNREIDVNDVQGDPAFFVLQVDLWADSADREANVVRASSNSPAVSISSATTTSYPPPVEHRPMPQDGQQFMYMSADGQPVYTTVPAYAMAMGRPQFPHSQYAPGMYYPHLSGQAMPYMAPTPTNSAMYTRNLIGSLTVNAAKLTDNEGKVGYWFVLQDLSVRTEGFFRLRMSFIDISNHGAPGVNRGKAPVLAWTFSEPFQVYSAKKFPGVIESTPLSKCFASQGIKIPIRKDNKSEAPDDDDAD